VKPNIKKVLSLSSRGDYNYYTVTCGYIDHLVRAKDWDELKYHIAAAMKK